MLLEMDGCICFVTDFLRVDINTRTGLVDRYWVNGVNYVGQNAFKPIVIADSEDAWGISARSFRNVEGEFKLMSPENGAKFSGVKSEAIPSIRVIEDGPVRSVVEAVFEYDDSKICMRYLLPKYGTEVELQLTVHWQQKDSMLKLQIPVIDNGCRYIGQTAYGVQELPTNGDEAVAQKWVAIVSESKALTCINDCIFGSDFSVDGLRLSLLRSPAYTGHGIGDRTILPQDRYTSRIDQGERTFRFWFNAGDPDERLNAIDREASMHNEKPFALSFFPSGLGDSPKQFLTLSDNVINLTATKMSEDGNDLIVRLFEPTGHERSTTISLPFCGTKHEIDMSGFEIKTLSIDTGTGSMIETDLMERPQ